MEIGKNPGEEIISFGRLLYDKNLIAGRDGNISVSLGEGKVLITASGVHKGLMEQADLVEIDLDGKMVSGTRKPSSEAMLHVETYKKLPGCRAIIHAHAPWSTAASLGNDSIDLTMLAEGRLLFGRVEVLQAMEPGSRELARLSSEAAKRAQIHILKAHGVVAWGKDLMDAFCLIEALEQNIRILGLCRACFPGT
jgi:L-fuculose-phosphate aldolase